MIIIFIKFCIIIQFTISPDYYSHSTAPTDTAPTDTAPTDTAPTDTELDVESFQTAKTQGSELPKKLDGNV